MIRISRSYSVVALYSVASFYLAHPAHAQGYSITDLNYGAGSSASDINNNGQIAGLGSAPGSFGYQGVFYNNGNVSYLSSGCCSAASSVNINGQAVGFIENGQAGKAQAVLWSGGTTTTLGGNSGSLGSYALGINNSGQIIGWTSSGFNQLATIWNGTTPTILGSGSANAINNNGQVVGNIGGQSVLWSNGTTTPLGMSQPYSINDNGQVVGIAADQAVLWSGGITTPLNTISVTSSLARDINNNGQVVGWSRHASYDYANLYGENATLWSNGNAFDLNQMMDASGTGWYLARASAINDLGLIVGSGINPLGQNTSFLLTPCGDCTIIQQPLGAPSPAVGAGLPGFLMIIAGFIGWRRSRRTAAA
jgi:probable HAF family extracellular repeat protein